MTDWPDSALCAQTSPVAGGYEIARIAEIIGVTRRTVARDLTQIRGES